MDRSIREWDRLRPALNSPSWSLGDHEDLCALLHVIDRLHAGCGELDIRIFPLLWEIATEASVHRDDIDAALDRLAASLCDPARYLCRTPRLMYGRESWLSLLSAMIRARPQCLPEWRRIVEVLEASCLCRPGTAGQTPDLLIEAAATRLHMLSDGDQVRGCGLTAESLPRALCWMRCRRSCPLSRRRQRSMSI